jgi:hypothetical protein
MAGSDNHCFYNSAKIHISELKLEDLTSLNLLTLAVKYSSKLDIFAFSEV